MNVRHINRDSSENLKRETATRGQQPGIAENHKSDRKYRDVQDVHELVLTRVVHVKMLCSLAKSLRHCDNAAAPRTVCLHMNGCFIFGSAPITFGPLNSN